MGMLGGLLGGAFGGTEDPSGMGGMMGFMPTGTTPQMMGYGIPDPSMNPYQDYNTGPGLQHGTPIQGVDMDMSGKQAGEQQWDAMKGQFNAPGAGQSSNNAQTMFDQYQGTQRNLPADAGLSGYYDNAVQHATGDINKQLASRGLFGSSEGLNQLGHATTDLRAEEANRNADYRLKTDAANQAWTGLGGNLAGGADASSRQGSQNELSWLNAGMQNALGAEGARTERTQNFFNNTILPAQMQAGMQTDAYNQMQQGDQDYFGNSIMFGTGMADDFVNRSDRQQQQNRQGLGDFMSMGFGSILGGGLGG